MNKKVKMFVFIASILVTLGSLHLAFGKCHSRGCFHEFEMQHCGLDAGHHKCCEKTLNNESPKPLEQTKAMSDSIK